MQKTEAEMERPFHETIIEAIKEASSPEKLECLAALIMSTKIPENHAAIIDAWEKRVKEVLGYSNTGHYSYVSFRLSAEDIWRKQRTNKHSPWF